MGLFNKIGQFFNQVVERFNTVNKTAQTQQSQPTLAQTSHPSSQKSDRTSDREFEQIEQQIYSRVSRKVMKELEKRANKWARATLAEFKNVVPVDTGNLRNSLQILDFQIDDHNNVIYARVGVDKDLILPPPSEMYSPHYGRKSDKMRVMPNYDYSPFILGDGQAATRAGQKGRKKAGAGDFSPGINGNDVTARFKTIAEKNLKKYIGKK